MAITEHDLHAGYRGTAPRVEELPAPDRTVEGVLLLNLLEQRVRELWKRRSWYRSHYGWIPEQQTEDRAELRYLVATLRSARAIAAPSPDPMDAAKALRDWTEGELREAWGR